MLRTSVGWILALTLSISHASYSQESLGTFRGELIVKTLRDGRNLELTHPFAFIDQKGKLWSVPVGTRVDGASIPQAFWSLIGGPFEDKYREASVIHDHYCDAKSETWEDVHLVFYNAMRASGVSSLQAKLLYAAVYNFGPRWIKASEDEKSPLISGQPVLLDSVKDAILKYVSDNDPDLETIRSISAQLGQVETAEQLEKILYEHANCTPIFFKADLSQRVIEKRVIILCGLSQQSKKQAALKNARLLIGQASRLLMSQRYVLVPALKEYSSSPTSDNWDKVQAATKEILSLVKLAMRPAVDLGETDDKELGLRADAVFDLLSKRSHMLHQVRGRAPQNRELFNEWADQYRLLLHTYRLSSGAIVS